MKNVIVLLVFLFLTACKQSVDSKLPGTKLFVHKDIRNSCFVTVKTPALSLRGDVFRQAGLNYANTLYNKATPRVTKSAPASPLMCTGSTTPLPQFNGNAYYGNLMTKSAYLQMVKHKCGSGSVTNEQFFSLGRDTIYYRNCQGGQGNGYIYFWGLDNGKKSQCFGGTYPEMYKEAGKKISISQMEEAYTTGLKDDSQASYARGNIMAALLIAESWRDYLVIIENYMLVDLAKARKVTTEQITAGQCVSGASHCQNNSDPKNGRHPIAWGGAQQSMMTGAGWGTNNGATSDFGESYEAALNVEWLIDQKHIAPDTKRTCKPGENYGNLSSTNQTRVLSLYTSLLP